jgi:hypothetical protein
LESGRSVTTDDEGRYRFPEVGEGAHVVSLDLERLPAEYNPGATTRFSIAVGARRTVRADFDLNALGSFTGKVTAVDGSHFESLEGIVIRLDSGGNYTTTEKDGTFAFYNVPEGLYGVSIGQSTLPPDAVLKSDAVVRVDLRSGTPPAIVRFEIGQQAPAEKPVRRVIDKVQDPAQSAPGEPLRNPSSGK